MYLVRTETRQLVPAGALFQENAMVVKCSSENELREVFSWAGREGKKLTLLGSGRSFGHHFRPVAGGLAVDVSELGRGARIVEASGGETSGVGNSRAETARAGVLRVRAGGGTRFCDLAELFPGYRVRFPPTSDRITLAGALAACTHNNNGYFADDVVAFRLLTPDGRVIECTPREGGLAGELFRAVPGAFGALGAISELELNLYPIDPHQLIAVHSLYAGPSAGGDALTVLERARDDERFTEGVGAVIYGRRGHAIVFSHEQLPLDYEKDRNQALLTDEGVEEHAFTQGLANRFPRLAEYMVTRAYPQGITRWAPWYGYQFFQRGYDRCPALYQRGGLKHRLVGFLGVDGRLPMVHAAWFFPRGELQGFIDAYFAVLEDYRDIAKYGEQQDVVLLGPCRWPAHSVGESSGAVGVFTASYSLAGSGGVKRKRIIEFFQNVTRVAHRDIPGCRISLSKQVHCEPVLLRQMHREWVRLIEPLRARVDPDRILTSQHLDALLGDAPAS